MGFRRGTDRQVGVFPQDLEIEESNDRRKVRRSARRAMFARVLRGEFDGEFTESDLKEMRKGSAPRAPDSQRTGSELYNKKINIHHKVPKRKFVCQKAANMLRNLIAMSPLYHEEGNFLDDEEHYGEYHGKRKKKLRRKKESDKRSQIR